MINLIEITTHIIKTTITMIDIEVMKDTEATVEIIHKLIIDLILDQDTTIDLKTLLKDLDMAIIIKEELHSDLHIDHHSETFPIIDIIPDQDIDLVPNHKETTIQLSV